MKWYSSKLFLIVVTFVLVFQPLLMNIATAESSDVETNISSNEDYGEENQKAEVTEEGQPEESPEAEVTEEGQPEEGPEVEVTEEGHPEENLETDLIDEDSSKEATNEQEIVEDEPGEEELGDEEELLPDKTLREGDRKEEVIQLKVNLENIGFKISNNPTNWYGPITTSVVKDFQSHYGLEVTGIADEETLYKIEEILASPLQEGARISDAIALKEDLSQLGFHISNNPTNYYGPITTRKVKEFQAAYRLPVSGIAEELTLAKIKELLASDMQQGARISKVIKLKEDLSQLGFHISNNPTNYYGPITTRKVKEFQATYGLPESGIAEELTLSKINEILSWHLQEGARIQEVITLKEDLSKVGFHVSNNPTTWYGPITTSAVEAFQKAHGLPVSGIADENVLKKITEIINSPLKNGARNSRAIQLKIDLDRAGFNVSSNPTNFYGNITETRVRQFQSYHQIPVHGIADQLTLTTLDQVLKGQVRAKVSSVVNGRQVYTYEQMQKDIVALKRMYPDIIETKIIGKSVDGRNLYAIKLGLGSTEIFINGSNHAREHMTTNVTMKMLDDYARAYVNRTRVDGYSARTILNRTSIWFVPMVNPDGVTLVQKGHLSAKNPQAVLKLNNNSTDFSHWKANIRGVDLNRQFPALWDTITNNTGKPGPMNYKGPKPLSEPETKALYDFTLSRDFKTAISYHSSGEVIFTRLDQEPYTRPIANMVSNATGYAIIDLKNSVSGGGFTDWFILSQKKPALTPEISPFVGPRPVPLSNWNTIWDQNRAVGIMLAEEAHTNRNRR